MTASHARWRRVVTIAGVAVAFVASSADGIVREPLPAFPVDRRDEEPAVPLAWYLRLHHATGETVATGAGLAVHGTVAGLDAWSDRALTLADREPPR